MDAFKQNLDAADGRKPDGRPAGEKPAQSLAAQAETLVREHYAMVYHYVRSLLSNGETAEDLVQQVFLVMLRKIPTDPPRGPVGPWLRGIARKLMLSSRATAGLDDREVASAVLDAADAALDDGMDRDALAECLTRLPDDERLLLDLRYTSDLRSAAIAEQLRQTRAWVRVRLHRIREKLRECVERHGGM
jgi:RNA polymerase sigma-70 factor (ECF subfamily)